jgi:hypothetical protein
MKSAFLEKMQHTGLAMKGGEYFRTCKKLLLVALSLCLASVFGLSDVLAQVAQMAKPLNLNENYELKIANKASVNCKFETSKGGDLSLAFEAYTEIVEFRLLNKNGSPVVSAKQDLGSGKVFGKPRTGRYQYQWDPSVEKIEGSITWKLDAGTYYIRVTRSGMGLSSVNMSLALKELNGNAIPAMNVGAANSEHSTESSNREAFDTGNTVDVPNTAHTRTVTDPDTVNQAGIQGKLEFLEMYGKEIKNSSGKVLSKDEIRAIMANVPDALAHYNGSIVHKNAAVVFGLLSAAIATGALAAFIAAGAQNSQGSTSESENTLFISAGLVAGSALFFTLSRAEVGKSNRNIYKALDLYNTAAIERQKPSNVSLNFGVTLNGGIGLTLNF